MVLEQNGHKRSSTLEFLQLGESTLISLLSLDEVYSVLNLQKEYSQGNQIMTYLFERLKTEKTAASTRKKAERKNVTFRFGRCQSTPPIMWIYFLQVLPFGNL